jgi:PKD repeat protein
MNNQIRLFALLITTFFAAQFSTAQTCNPSYVLGNECTGSIIQFKANAPGFSSYSWEFKDSKGNVIATSSDRDPAFSFTKADTYSVTLTATGVSGTCSKTISVPIKPSPIAKPVLITAQEQCFKGNLFQYIDSSTAASGSTIIRCTYLFGDGRKYEKLNPTFGDTISHTVIDPNGGWFNLKVELEDANGCVTEHYIDSAIHVYQRLGVYISSNSPTRCDSTTACLTNETYLNWKKQPGRYIDLEDVAEFVLDFGDGNVIVGDSVTNTDYWTGPNKDGIICYTYRTAGVFDVTLSVTSKDGCNGSYTYKKAATNVKLHNPRIIADRDSFPADYSPVHFRLDKGPIPGAGFLWNFGDPTSGPLNHDNRTWEPGHAYSSLGPKMISLRIVSGPCDIQIFDTVVMYGPNAQIEAPFDRIAFNERYQCHTKDTVQFTNNSTFYHNDPIPRDEDSIVTVDGEKRFAFHFDPKTRHGDQTALTSNKHLGNRTMGSQIYRLWNFGDKYALQCTTSTELKLNVGKNCNYSLDEKPKHLYPNWDTVYHYDYFLTNDTLDYFYFDSVYNCHTRGVDTSEPALHRKLFMQKYPHNFTASLFLKDNILLSEDVDQVLIVTTRPDASKMTLEKGIPCPLDGNNSSYYMEFDLNTGSQSYFAINYDSAKGKDNFHPFNSGRVLAPPAPGLPVSFVVPYEVVGTYGDRFVKGYTSGELGNDWSNGPRKDITLGVVVANGPLDVNGQPLGCTDTAWYSNALRYNRMDAEFDIIGDKKSVCKGEDIYLKLKRDQQFGINALRLNYGHQDRLRGYYETFHYLEEYNGPVTGRNDENVTYKGEDWRYNYVVRHNLDELLGDVTLDTIVTAIVKDWKTTYEIPDRITTDYFNNAGYFNPLQDKSWHKALGKCIDTTGWDLKTIRTEYFEQDDHVVRHGNKRYRYTNTSQTDSIEVTDILHFRAYSLQGFDTLIDGKDTIPGLWKISFDYYEQRLNEKDPTKKDTFHIASSGIMTPGLYLSNVDGCQQSHSKWVNVGFMHHNTLESDVECAQNIVQINDSIRYWQHGYDAYPNDFPIDPRKFWEDPVRYANGKLELKSIDWDSTDGIQPERSLVFYHQYDEPGKYVITLMMQDSMGCKDTSFHTVNASGVKANFNVQQSLDQCIPTVKLQDSSYMVFAPNAKDSVVWYEWNFEDGSPRSVLKNPSHAYRNFGAQRIKLKVFTLLGCVDSTAKLIVNTGPQPEFDFDNIQWNGNDTAVIYEGDLLKLRNLSKTPQTNPKFVMNWGDGSVSNVSGSEFTHTYQDSGVYNLYLTMEDEVNGGPVVCTRMYPDTMPDPRMPLIHEVVVVRKDTTGHVANFNKKARLYPNPSNGQIYIESDDDLVLHKVRVIDAIGREVAIRTNITGTNAMEVDIVHVVTGHYTVLIETSKGLITKKIALIQP